MQALSTVFTPPPWCTNRFAVYIDNIDPGTSTLNPSSGWVDRAFTNCVPTQYTTRCPTFSPGVCPQHMSVVTSTSHVYGTNTVWTGGCCQSGFATVDFEPRFLCTSVISTPMAFLLDPNISTADIYTTLSTSSLMLEHDQMTVQWERTDLPNLPSEVAESYASMMGIAFTPTTQSPSLTSYDIEPSFIFDCIWIISLLNPIHALYHVCQPWDQLTSAKFPLRKRHLILTLLDAMISRLSPTRTV
ncbi:hypothetical protein F5X96DRAFT_673589 [Biscogniauxia mediterranea]|nr:hypothetical protein F5X96DRAFT_673589 [Biscogniauxia mediterranea]